MVVLFYLLFLLLLSSSLSLSLSLSLLLPLSLSSLLFLFLCLVEADDDDNDDGADDADPTLHLLACWPAVGRQPLKLSFQIMPSVAVQASASHLPQNRPRGLANRYAS